MRGGSGMSGLNIIFLWLEKGMDTGSFHILPWRGS